MRRIRERLTYANVISTICLFLLLGGGAYAAFHLPKNSVKSRNIKNGQVKSADVADNAVNGAKIADNSVTGSDVKESTLDGLVQGQMLDFNVDATGGPGVVVKPIATVGPYTLKASCSNPSGSVAFEVLANGPAGFAETEFSQVNNDTTDAGDHSQSAVPSANVDTNVLDLDINSGFTRSGGTFVIRSNSGTLVQVLFSVVLDHNANNGGGACHLWGTATTG